MQTKLLRYLIFLLVYAPPLKGVAQINLRDSLALVDLYDSTNGANWKNRGNWKTLLPVNTWSGVTVTNNRVTGLWMVGNNGNGIVPATFKNLDSMLSIYLIDNGFTGNLLSYISNFKEIISIHLAEQFLGPFPDSLGYLPKLKSIYIYGPGCTGPIPASFGNLTSLRFLDVSYSAHSGDFPAEELSNLNFGPDSLILSANRYTFKELEPLVAKFILRNKENVLVYNNQPNIPTSQYNGRVAVSAGGVLAHNTYSWYKEGTGLVAAIVGDSTYRMLTPGTYHALVTNSVATKLTLNSIPVNSAAVLVPLCPMSAPVTITSDVATIGFQKSLDGPYQWEQSVDGVNFNFIFDNANFSGTQSRTLQLQNIPSSWGGRRYRCETNYRYSTIFIIYFPNTWIGSGTTNWENAANWSCGTVPDTNTDVVINSGNVVVNSNVTVRSLYLAIGVNFTVMPGYTLTIVP